ncbi:MAG: RDD family protein [Clostridia bacterium]|nr:RDD family protein [Clostridia bacterium]
MISDLQKANMLKRISAYIFDFILLVTLAVGIAALLSGMLGYDDYTAQRQELRAEFEAQWGVSFDIPEEDYAKLTDEQRALYDEAYTTFATDEKVNGLDVKIINLTLLITVLSVLIPYLLLEFWVPLLFGHGRTLGKKIFSIAVMRVDGVRLSTFQLFVRTVLGKYTLETMIPLFLALLLIFTIMPLACMVGLALLALLQLSFLLTSPARTVIHDMIAGTVTVDFASQMIFDTPEELLAYKEKLHAEAAQRAAY